MTLTAPMSFMPKERKLVMMVTVVFCLVLVFSLCTGAVHADAVEPDKNASILLEVLNIVKQRAIFIDQQVTREQLTQTGLQVFLSQHDQHSQFLNPKEYRRFKEYQKENYVGLGMELEKNTEGDVLCFPYPDSPAYRAGIKSGDKLLAINGEEVANKSLFALTALATGKAGTQVKLRISTDENKTKEVIARLSNIQTKSVSMWWENSILVIKIAFFSSQTKFDLVNRLDRISPNQVVVLDLRGNPGGDFYAALECADLFIPKGKLLISAIGKDNQIPYRSSSIKKYLNPKLFIWQNHGTASAAEVFIAAMTENGRAVSIGENSYGKGTKQNIFELSDGSALILTTEYLMTSNGVKYNGIGILPTYPLEDFSLQSSNYVQRVMELLKRP